MKKVIRAMAVAQLGGLVAVGGLSMGPAALAAGTDAVAGVVRDALQRPIAGAQVHLETPDGKIVAHGTTAQDGKFSLSGATPGIYSLIGEKPGFATSTAVVTVGAHGAASDLTLASQQALDLKVTSEKLAAARTEIEPRIGATTYTLTSQDIANQPGGSEIPLNRTLLQAPGVSQDSFGQIHLRNDHANIQYRINGVILPEGISLFGQALSSRFASSIDLLTGSLPAQYGLVTTGIVDIQTKSGAFDNGGSVGIYGGSRGWLEPSAEYGGSVGQFNYYVSGDYTQNEIGVENPTNSHTPIHDSTQQGHGFAYLEDVIDPSSKISAILGTFHSSFQIPNTPGQPPAFQLGDRTDFDSSQLNENQTEGNDFGALTYLKSTKDYDFQISGFIRHSTLQYTPDPVGDLMFYGIAQNASRDDLAEGLQGDGTYRLGNGHTLRFGGLITAEHASSHTSSQVFPCLDSACETVGTSPVSVADASSRMGYTYSAYLQDEWKILPTVTVNYGLRFDQMYAYTNSNQFSPRINVVWKPRTDTTVHAGYSRYFTPPALEGISGESISKFAGTTGYPAGYTPDAPPLSDPILPERSHYFDIGADHEFMPGLKLGVDAFYKIADDLIDEGQFGSPIILSVFNYAHANVYGGELTGSYERGNFSAYGNIAVGRERAKTVASQQFNFSPDDLAFIANNYIYTDHSQWVTASAGIAYNWHGTRLSADMIYGSGLRQDGAVPNGSTVPSYTQVNLGVSHRFERAPGGPIEVSLNLQNAFDESYQIRSGSGVGVFAPQYGPRLGVFGGVRKYF